MVPGKSDREEDAPPSDRRGSPEACRWASLTAIVEALNQDFLRLVGTLERMVELVGEADQELIQQLSSTRDVAQQGVRLTGVVKELVGRKSR